MGKTKSKQAPRKAAGTTKAAPNPFEMKKTKSRFNVLGRSLKGSSKNVVKARTDAVNRRKSSLLVEYKAIRKANQFNDKRFGQNDAKMSEDDKAFIRLQAQRVKKSHHDNRLGGGGKKVKFSLAKGEEGQEEELTHLGKSLSEVDTLDEAPAREEDVDEEEIEEMMKEYNFGGGEEGKGPDGRPKTRKEVMEEIIAKSRAFKAQRQKQKEDDIEEMVKLDKEYHDLFTSQALSQFIKPKGYGKENKIKADNKLDLDYDVAARELAFEAKGSATDRTLAPEEAAEKERQRLEVLEKERVKRMKGVSRPTNDDDEEGVGAGLDESLMARGGYAARRAKIRAKQGDDSEDEDDDEEGEEEDEDEDEDDDDGDKDDNLTKRRMTRAAGDHPLQSSLREKAAELAGKYGLGKIKNPMMESENEDEEGEDDDDGEDAEGKDDDGEEGEEGEEEEEGTRPQDEEEEGEEEGDDDYERDLRDLKGEISDQPPSTSGRRPESRADEIIKNNRKRGLEPPSIDIEGAPLDLPFTLPVPESYEKFQRLVEGRPADQLALAVQRIRSFNSSDLASDNKRKLQVLYGILVQHFANLSGSVPISSPHLDALLPSLLATTAEVPFYAATVARTRMLRLNDRLTAALSGSAPPPIAPLTNLKKQKVNHSSSQAVSAPQESSWPSPRALLQLKLFLTLFPASDKRHPVLTPVSLFIGRALSQCVANDIGEVVRGLFLSSLALNIASSANRHFPEVLTFLTDTLLSFVDQGKAKVEEERTRCCVARGLLTPETKGKGLAKLEPSQINLYESLSIPAGSDSPHNDEMKLGLLSLSLKSILTAVDIDTASCKDAYPEIVKDTQASLLLLQGCHLPPSLEKLRSELLFKINQVSLEAIRDRRPLSRPVSSSKVPGSLAQVNKEFNPCFEDGFVKGRDYDPDRERALDRKAKKVAAKEKRGKMRETRKDALFISDQRDKEKAQVDRERMESQRSFYSILEKQSADIRSGGQSGGVKRKRKK